MMGLSKKDKWKDKGMKVIEGHKGKQKVYDAYQKANPKMAEEYVRFHAKNPDAVYISWDEDKGRFVS